MGLLWDPRFSFALFLVIVRDLQWRFAMKAIIIVILNCLKSLSLFWFVYFGYTGLVIMISRLFRSTVKTSEIGYY